ncbi:NfeD family protein [Sciscionella sediminilitoris]|uniref:NfeD family protein n=1 Tax=Sciscionella sediminilitoris TaxID=1445613 RepID=UPI0004DF54D7|nr:NfeD family protein [Sciscionella sp. SE31]
MWPIVWLVLGLVLVAAETLSGDFVLVMLGIGALGAAGAGALGANPLISAIVFAVLSVAMVLGIRPVVKRRFHAGTITQTNTDALVGADAVAITEVTNEDGRVKIRGDVWSARSLESEVIKPGADVTVVEISGATAVVIAKS